MWIYLNQQKNIDGKKVNFVSLEDSFLTKEKARKLRDKIKRKGYYTFVREYPDGGGYGDYAVWSSRNAGLEDTFIRRFFNSDLFIICLVFLGMDLLIFLILFMEIILTK